jgi:REP element-mobilizing transposase RayT
MPRRETPFLPDQYYHFYNRGNNRKGVFFERESPGRESPGRDNYLYFLKGIKQYLCTSMDVLAYCLMPTHFHLLVRVNPQPPRQVSLAMQKLGISYTKAINKRFGRVGALFQGQFRGKLIQKYEHLLSLCLYNHTNPVKDGLVDLPENWEYSNYLEWIGLRPGTLFDREFIQEQFGTSAEYKNLVRD